MELFWKYLNKTTNRANDSIITRLHRTMNRSAREHRAVPAILVLEDKAREEVDLINGNFGSLGSVGLVGLEEQSVELRTEG